MGTGDRTPLLLLHGGPGGRSCAFSVLSDLAGDRRVIYYDHSDQANRIDRTVSRCGAPSDSSRSSTRSGRRWTCASCTCSGHSWGRTLATEYCLPRASRAWSRSRCSSRLISTPALARGYAEATTHAAGAGPGSAQQCEAVETADDPACVAANDVFEEHFVRGAKALPAVPECEGVTGGDQVYRHMWGAGEFTATGTLRDYDRTDRLGELKLPVLFLAGRHDEAVPETVADFQRRVPGAKMTVFENSAHGTYRTETAEYVKMRGSSSKRSSAKVSSRSEPLPRICEAYILTVRGMAAVARAT